MTDPGLPSPVLCSPALLSGPQPSPLESFLLSAAASNPSRSHWALKWVLRHLERSDPPLSFAAPALALLWSVRLGGEDRGRRSALAFPLVQRFGPSVLAGVPCPAVSVVLLESVPVPPAVLEVALALARDHFEGTCGELFEVAALVCSGV